MTTDLQTVGAMHQCKKGELYSTCIHCGAIAEKLNSPCPNYMRQVASHGQAPAQPDHAKQWRDFGRFDDRPTPSPQAAQQAPAGATDPWQQHMANQAEVIDCEALQRAMVQHGISFPEGGMEYFRASLGEMVNRFVRFAAPAAPSTPASGGWMPIETAPKYTGHGVTKHLLLGYAPDETHEEGFVAQGYWMEAEEDAPDNMGHDGGWVDVNFDFFSCGRSFGAEAYRTAGTQPTHWQPLPASPTIEGESK